MQDPFSMKVPEIPGGTKDKPTLVSSTFEERIVGCICEFSCVYVELTTYTKQCLTMLCFILALERTRLLF